MSSKTEDRWTKNLEVYDKLVSMSPNFERKGKTMPYTSVNGHMFSLFNKDGDIGIRLSKEEGEQFMKDFDTTRFRSHGAFMQGYVLVPEKLYKDMDLMSEYLNKAYEYVLTLEPK